MEETDKVSPPERNPVPMVERLAYVLREYEDSHAGWAEQMVNGRAVDGDGEPWPRVKTDCQCQHCKDARVVLGDYDAGMR